MSVLWAIYRGELFWPCVSLTFLVLGIVVGNDIGKAYRQPRDAKGRFVK
jgi:hypothetical protein